MKTFKIGGIHPEENKLAKELGISLLDLQKLTSGVGLVAVK